MEYKSAPKLRATGLALAAGFAAPSGHTRPPEAGIEISNRATVSYLNTRLGLAETIDSNTVSARVREVLSIDVLNNSSLVRSPGDTAQFTFRVVNTGNADVDVLADFSQLDGDFNFLRTDSWLDVNENGQIDPGDRQLDPSARVAIPLDESVNVLVDVQIPFVAVAGNIGSGELRAVIADAPIAVNKLSGPSPSDATVFGQVQDAGLGEVRVTDVAASVLASADLVQSDGGNEIIYTFSLRNNSTRTIIPQPVFDGELISLDGVDQNLLILRADIPLNTNFDRILEAVNFDPIFHRRGEDENEWVSTPPDDLSLIDAIAFVSRDPLPSGSSRDFQFSVEIAGNAEGTTIESVAEFLIPDGFGSAIPSLSNRVSTFVEGGISTLMFFDNPDLEVPIDAIGFDQDLFVDVSSGRCNISAERDLATVTLRVAASGDVEVVSAVETAPNSGIFRIDGGVPTAKAPPALVGDGILQGPRRSEISATIDCDTTLAGALTFGPAGAVFSSVTNEPVPGVRVEVIDASGTVISETVTDSEGLYDMVSATAGMHTLRVTPPAGLTAPSQRTSFVGFGRNVLNDASFAQPFAVSSPGRNLDVDVPVDPDLVGALAVSKSGDRTRVSLGEIIQYTVDVRNTSTVAIQGAGIFDQLPPGLDLVEGSVLLDGGPLTAVSGEGRMLTFEVGLIGPNDTANLTYAVRVLPTAGAGDKINTAQAIGTAVGFADPIRSNLAAFTVNVDPSEGVFSREGVVLGKVFLDCNANGVQDGDSEPGIPGVQIVTQEGLSVVTDAFGRYSLPQLDPRTHVLDVREATLPGGTEVAATHVFDTGRAGSRFVPLRAGDLRTEDFAVVGCAPDVLEKIRVRMTALRERTGSGVDLFSTQSQIQFDQSRAGFQAQHQSAAKSAVVSSGNPRSVPAVTAQNAALTPATLEDQLKLAGDAIAFADLADGQQLIRQSVSIRATAPAGLALELWRNGARVEDSRLGQQIGSASHQAVEFVAIALTPGANTLTLIGRDSFGNERETASITVTVPGEPARVQLLAPATAIADPATPVPIRLQIVDATGHPAAASIEATLEALEDTFDVRDVSEQTPGLQTRLEDGQAVVDLVPSELVGTRTISVDTPYGRAEARIRFTPALDNDRIAVGYVEGALGIGANGAGALPDVFDRDEISPFEDTEDGVEGALFLKGRLFNRALLTLRHDSARNIESDLFRSVEPDEFYPIYGDQSERGFDARSRGKTFGKLEYDSSYVLFGDVAYDAAASALQLGAFQRTLEGAKGHAEFGRLALDLYAGQTDTGQVVVELPALGISGPYNLDFGEVVENSETVELVTRDRNQPGVILRTETLGRFSAYTLDYFNRTLIFNRPIPSRDENLNPVSIRVTFETDPGEGEDYWLFGGEAAFALTDWLSVGYRQLTSDAPEGTADDRTVRATYLAANVGESGRLEVEAAQSINPLDDSGLGVRLSYEQQTARGSFGARIASTTEDFDAPGASVSSGRDEARLFGTVRVGPGTLNSEALHSADQGSAAERYGVVGRYEAAVTDHLRLRAGSRYVNDTDSGGRREDALTVIAGASWSPKLLEQATLDLEAEQEVTDGAQSRVSLGADYVLTPKIRLYGQADYTGSQSGSFGLTDSFNDDLTVRFGGEYRWTDRVTAFSEYRANEDFFDNGVANGLTASWSISPALNLRVRGEHVQPISDTFLRNTALGVGGTWEPESGKRILDGDLEYAAGQGGQRSWYTSFSAGQRWKDVTFLARNRYAQTSGGGSRRERDRFRVGAAHRPTGNNKLNTLVWYEYELDDQSAFEEQRHIWSLGGEWQPGARIGWRGRFAGQEYAFSNPIVDEQSTTFLVQGGGDWDVHKRVNMALNASLITDSDIDNYTWGVGAEMNVHVVDNLLIGVGYNYTEIDEVRIDRLFRSGFFFRLRAKIDQNIWNIFDRDS